MKSIVIIIPYFGLFPTIFPFWKQSALNNNTIDFLLFTDNEQIQSEKNIKVFHISFSECRDLIQKHFDFQIVLKSPYKLCNFKPAYGDIFQEYIKGYDFWGFGDVDLIYGNLRSFITEDVLNKYEYVSGWGHLTLFKNNEYWNSFYKTYKEGFQYYKDVFSSDELSRFDEYLNNGISDLAKSLHGSSVWDSRLFDDVYIPASHLEFNSVFHPEVSDHLIFEYFNKSLFRVFISNNSIKKEPIEYAHFQRRANLRIRTFETNKYIVIPNSVIEHTSIEIDNLSKWGKSRRIENFIRRAINKFLRVLKIKYQLLGGY